MRFVPRILCSLLLLSLSSLLAQSPVRFKTWIAGQEAGGSENRTLVLPEGIRMESSEWISISRGDANVRQSAKHAATKAKDGRLDFVWSLLVAQEPLEGKASWNPSRPGLIRLESKGGAPKEIPVPKGAVLWPGDAEDRMKVAAKARRPIQMQTFNPDAEGWNAMDMSCEGPDPLPGFLDAVRYRGSVQEGPMKLTAELWISPESGELRQSTELMGLPLLTQRAELPPPGAAPQAGLFERSMKRLPPHPFAAWVPDLTVRWTGTGSVDVPEDLQQQRAGDRRLHLKRAALPSPEELRALPVRGKASAEDAPFLEATPLVPYRDPVFEGVLFRLAAPDNATRWELAQRITSFVFDWITEKDYTVGFASAAEVCRTPRGDCTEHGVLAVALLRRLGVPARGALGWVALGDTLALHFWAEVRLKERWIPIDPTFDQAPASAFRIKLGTTNLENLATVGWDGAAQVFGSGQWLPEREGDLPWGKGYYVEGDLASGPATGRLTLPGATWAAERGRLRFQAFGTSHRVEACMRPGEAQLRGAVRVQSLAKGRSGWYLKAEKRLWIHLGDRWLEVDNLREQEAGTLMEALQYSAPTP